MCAFMERVLDPVLTDDERRGAWADAKWDALPPDGKVSIALFLQDRGM
jgi:hypothetical protein